MKEDLEEKGEECEHEWEAIGRDSTGSHLELRCKKCGKKREIPLFP